MKLRVFILILSIIILCGIVGFQVHKIYNQNGHHFIYPLDDTYIHLAIGKNLAGHGIWGVTKEGFTSSSSSILYTLLLAGATLVAGNSEWTPLIINILSGILLFYLLFYISLKEKMKTGIFAGLSLTILFFAPLPAMIITGMEHSLQILLFLLFFYEASKLVSQEPPSKSYIYICLLAFLVVMIRFEGIFLVAAFCLLLLYQRRYKILLSIALAGALPVLLFGLYSLANEGLPLPNSLLLKGQKPKMDILGFLAFAFVWMDKLFNNPHLLYPFIFMAITLIVWHKLPNREVGFEKNMLIVALITFIIHLTLAKTGWFFRYEAYLVVIGLFVLAFCFDRLIKFYDTSSSPLSKMQFGLICFFALVLLFQPMAIRMAKSLKITAQASKNIYEQQIQMAEFLNAYFKEEGVVANDIGAISYFNEIRLFDMYGLANLEVLKLKLDNNYTKADISFLTQKNNSKIAIIYDHWFPGQIPDSWRKVGEWTISNNVICGGETVSFYAVDLSYENKLSQSLRQFSGRLPGTVLQSGPYVLESLEASKSY